MGELNELRGLETITARDGWTTTVVFTRGTSDGYRESLAANADRVRDALNAYTDLQHYLGGTLFRQQLHKLRKNIEGRWACRGVSDPAGVLERTI